MTLYYDEYREYDVQIYDEVVVVIEAADIKFPATVTKIHEKSRKLTLTFEGLDPVLDLILPRKSARVPLSAVEFVGRSF